MYIYLRHVKPLGFKGNGMYSDAKFHSHYYKVNPKTHTVTVIGNLIPQTISQFVMTPSQFKRFQNGQLSPTPPDCCNATGNPSIEQFKLIFSGAFTNIKHVKEILATINI